MEYDQEVQLFTAKLCVLAPLLHPPEGFETLVHTHLFEKRKLILATLRRWVHKAQETAAAAGGHRDEECDGSSSKFAAQLNSVIAEIEQAYRDRMTRRYAEDDCRECEQVIGFIQEKMHFLTEKIRFSSAAVASCTCTCTPCESLSSRAPHSMTHADEDKNSSGGAAVLSLPLPVLCGACRLEAETRLPKAYARYCLGPRLLAQAHRDLQRALQERDRAPHSWTALN